MKFKNIVLVGIIIFSLVLTGCMKSEQEIYNEFEELAGSKLTVENMLKLSSFIESNLSKLSKDNATTMMMSYEDVLLNYIDIQLDQTLIKELAKVYDDELKDVVKDKIVTEELKEFYDVLVSNDMNVEKDVDGNLRIYIDYESLISHYKSSMPESIFEMYMIKDLEAKEPSLINGSLNVEWKELLNRALEIENLLELYGDNEAVISECKFLINKYMTLALVGTTTNPVFDYKTGEFSEDIILQFKEFIEEESNSEIGYTLENYFEYLESINYKLNYKDTDNSKAFLNNCTILTNELETRVIK